MKQYVLCMHDLTWRAHCSRVHRSEHTRLTSTYPCIFLCYWYLHNTLHTFHRWPCRWIAR